MSPEELAEKEKSEKRLAYMTKALSRFEIRQPGKPPVVAKVTKKPLLRWLNPQSSSRDGILSLYAAGGRPVAMGQFAIYEKANPVHEFHMTTEEPFELRRGKEVYWKSDKPTIRFQALEDVKAPVSKKALRTAQMRRIAAGFKLWDDHGWTKTVRQPLRLLTQPIYRYTDKQRKVTDGAVFVFALSNDPEAVLLLEAIDTEAGPAWRYAFSPVTIYKLEAKRGEEVVWTSPERRVFDRGYLTQFAGGYKPDATDQPLQDIMPAPGK